MNRSSSTRAHRFAVPSILFAVTILALAGPACSSEPDPEPVDAAPEPIDTPPPPEIDAAPPPPPLFSHTRGFYAEPFELVLSPDDGVDAYYTDDGRDPAGATATQYTGPMTVDQTTILRVAFKVGDQVMGETVTHTYLFPEGVPDQAPPFGYPVNWWVTHPTGPWPSDYAMDPEIVDSTGSGHMFPDTFYAIPAVSIVLDPDDLFGATGIHELSWMEGPGWERAGSFEVLKHEARPHAQINSGILIAGDLEREPDRSPKKSFRVEFDAQYGPDTLQYDLYEDNGIAEFSTLVLTAGYQRTWIHSSSGGRRRAQYIREPFAAASQRDMGHVAPRSRHAHVFLNGLYWGLYHLQERPDAAFQAANSGGMASEYDVLHGGAVIDGDRAVWDQMITLVEGGLDSPGAYQALAQTLDIENFTDHVILQHYLGNTDWPEENWFAARRRTTEGRYRFFHWDAEAAMGDALEDITGIDEPDTPARIFQELQANAEYMVYFADRVHKHLSGGGALTPARGLERWDDIAKDAIPAVFGESARWGDHLRDDRMDPEAELYNFSDHWNEEAERIEEHYLTVRNNIVLQQYRDAGLYPQLDAPILVRQGGPVPAGYQLTVLGTGVNRDVYYTLDGSDPRLAGGAIAPAAQLYSGPVTIDANLTLSARTRSAVGEWSALAQAEFTLE